MWLRSNDVSKEQHTGSASRRGFMKRWKKRKEGWKTPKKKGGRGVDNMPREHRREKEKKRRNNAPFTLL